MPPEHHLDRFWRDCSEMMPESQKICKYYYLNAEKRLQQYTGWRTSDWVASIARKIKAEKKLMLVYNTIWEEDLSLKIEDVPSDWVITTDRQYLQQADVIVFHLPDLHQQMENDLYKPDGQIWVGWYVEPEKNFSWIKEQRNRESFDLFMNYRQDADIVYPYYTYEILDYLSQNVAMNHKRNTIIFSASNKINYLYIFVATTPFEFLKKVSFSQKIGFCFCTIICLRFFIVK